MLHAKQSCAACLASNLRGALSALQCSLQHATYHTSASTGQAAMPQPVQEDTMAKILEAQVQDMRDAGTFKKERVITSPQGPSISATSSVQHAKILYSTQRQL